MKRHLLQKQSKVSLQYTELIIERWPVLLTKTIADVRESMKSAQSATQREEGETIIREIEQLKRDMEQNRPLR